MNDNSEGLVVYELDEVSPARAREIASAVLGENFVVYELDGVSPKTARRIAARIVRSVNLRNGLSAFVVGLLLLLSAAAPARAQNLADALKRLEDVGKNRPPTDGRVYVVRTVFFTVSPRHLPRFPVTVTDAQGKVTLPPVVEAASLLDGGQMGTALFAAELKKLEAAGVVKLGSRPSGIVNAGETLNLSFGAEIPVAVAGLEDKDGLLRSTTTGYIIDGSQLNLKVEELGDDDTYTVDVEAESAEPDGGTVQLASIKTRLEMRRGKTFIFKLGTSPDNSRENYFAVGVEPAPPVDVRAR
jgi:hypothetical protein